MPRNKQPKRRYGHWLFYLAKLQKINGEMARRPETKKIMAEYLEKQYPDKKDEDILMEIRDNPIQAVHIVKYYEKCKKEKKI